MNSVILTEQILRVSGTILYFLFFAVLVIRISRTQISDKLAKLFYPLLILHPVLFVFLNYLTGGGINPYAAFINACLICKTPSSYFYSIGIAAFWFSMLALFFTVKKWKYSYVLGYAAFFLIGVHGFFLGEYFRLIPIIVLAGISYIIVLAIFFIKEFPKILKDFKNWVKN